MSDLESIVKEIKKDFFRFRNGIVAGSLKNLYEPGTMIFGLMQPQLMEISKKYPKDLELGLKLWADKTSRESRLFSLYILPPSLLDKQTAINIFLDVRNIEEADFLAFKILRHLPFAKELYKELESLKMSQPAEYCLKMFKKNMEALNIG